MSFSFSFSRHINLHQFCSICNIWVYKNKHKHTSTNSSTTIPSFTTSGGTSAGGNDQFIHITNSSEENLMFLVPISMPKSALGLENILKKQTKNQETQTDSVTILQQSVTVDVSPVCIPVTDDESIPVELSQTFSDPFESITAEEILNKLRSFWINSEDYYTCDKVKFDCVYDIVMFPPSSNHEEMKTEVFNLWNEECANNLQYDQCRELNCFI